MQDLSHLQTVQCFKCHTADLNLTLMMNILVTQDISWLTLYSIIVPFDAFEISCIWNIMEKGAFALLFENIMENRGFAPKEQMLHFP